MHQLCMQEDLPVMACCTAARSQISFFMFRIQQSLQKTMISISQLEGAKIYTANNFVELQMQVLKQEKLVWVSAI